MLRWWELSALVAFFLDFSAFEEHVDKSSDSGREWWAGDEGGDDSSFRGGEYGEKLSSASKLSTEKLPPDPGNAEEGNSDEIADVTFFRVEFFNDDDDDDGDDDDDDDDDDDGNGDDDDDDDDDDELFENELCLVARNRRMERICIKRQHAFSIRVSWIVVFFMCVAYLHVCLSSLNGSPWRWLTGILDQTGELLSFSVLRSRGRGSRGIKQLEATK